MINNKFQIDVPTSIIENWQEIVDILAEIIAIPALTQESRSRIQPQHLS